MSTFLTRKTKSAVSNLPVRRPESRAKFRVNGTTARMTNPIHGIRRMADSVALRHQRHENRESGGQRLQKTQLRHHATFLFDITTGGIKWRFIRKG